MAAKKSRFMDQAALESLVRFGPQLDALREAQRVAEGTYSSSVAQARAGARGVQQAVDQALPVAGRAYDRAGLDQARLSQTLIGKDLAGLGQVADSIKGGAALEAAGMGTRLTEARANTISGLNDRRVQAASGAIASERQAGDQLVKDLTRILQSKKDVGGQKGAFEAATIGDLEQAARDRSLKVRLNNADNSQSERNSIRSSGIDPATGEPIPGGKLDPKTKRKGLTATGAKAVSPDAHLSFANTVQEISNAASKYKGKLSRAQIVEKLKKGRPAMTIHNDPDTGAKLTNPVPLPGIKAYPADLAMTAALDVALDGHLARTTQRALQQHYVLSDLGLPTYAEWRKRNPPAPKKTRGAERQAYSVVQQLAQSLAG